MKDISLPQAYQEVINKISTTSKEYNFTAYIVGGFVRDLFMDREPKDLDIMVCAGDDNIDAKLAGVSFSKILAKKYNLCQPVIFEKFGTAKLFIDNQEVEFVMPRKEYYDAASRNPNTQVCSLEQDALRRDFTVNALFLRLSDMQILDFTHKGIDDIRDKVIRVADTANTEIIFRQDPLRILRAVRQSLQLGFTIEIETYMAMKASVERIEIVSPERIRDEINKILVEDSPSKAFIAMDDIGLLDKILPEVTRLKNIEQPKQYHTDDVFFHSLKVLDRTRNNIILRMAALLHDVGKYSTYRKERDRISFFGHDIESVNIAEFVLSRLKYSKEFIKKTLSVIKNHMSPKMYSSGWSDAAIRRFVQRCDGELDLVFEISRADYGRNNDDLKLIELQKRIDELRLKNMLYPKQKLLTGKEIMEALGKPAGEWIGKAKSKVEEMLFEDPKLTKEKALLALEKIFK